MEVIKDIKSVSKIVKLEYDLSYFMYTFEIKMIKIYT